MPRRRPIRHIFKWVGFVLCVLIVAVWGLSLRWGYRHRGEYGFIYCAKGDVFYWKPNYHPPVGGSGVFHRHGWDVSQLRWSWGLVGVRLPVKVDNVPVNTVNGKLYGLGLWLPCICIGFPAAILFYRDRRRIPPGHCQKCGYNLTGNESGKCPECGKPCEGGLKA